MLQSNRSLQVSLPSYSGVVSGAKPRATEEKSGSKMVTLVSDRNKIPSPQSSTEESDQMDIEDAGKSAVKRQHSAGEPGDTDEEVLPGFTKVEGNRKSLRLVKKVMSPLEVLSSGSIKVDKNKRSSSK